MDGPTVLYTCCTVQRVRNRQASVHANKDWNLLICCHFLAPGQYHVRTWPDLHVILNSYGCTAALWFKAQVKEARKIDLLVLQTACVASLWEQVKRLLMGIMKKQVKWFKDPPDRPICARKIFQELFKDTYIPAIWIRKGKWTGRRNKGMLQSDKLHNLHKLNKTDSWDPIQ